LQTSTQSAAQLPAAIRVIGGIVHLALTTVDGMVKTLH
jgi:hypothetical protein